MKSALCSIALTAATALAQTTANVTWQLSLDNGTTWQTGLVNAPLTQTSVLARASVQILDNGVPHTNFNVARFAEGKLEAYVRSTSLRSDLAANVQVIGPGLPARLRTAAFVTSQHDNVFKIDRFGDTQAPGLFIGFNAQNLNTPTGDIPSTLAFLPILQYRLDLDGTVGTRTFDGGFLALTGFTGTTAGTNQVLTYLLSNPNATVASDVTQIPATLTVIPTPTTLTLFTITSLFATRRRRPR